TQLTVRRSICITSRRYSFSWQNSSNACGRSPPTVCGRNVSEVVFANAELLRSSKSGTFCSGSLNSFATTTALSQGGHLLGGRSEI
ncbi:MAG: hypothetical protein ACREOZ_02460, partial [Gloeomargaritales cyanobacterium]